MTATMSRIHRFAAFVVAVALLTVCLAGTAVAEESDNLVNTQQLPDSSFIYDTDIASLDSADTYYDKQTVQIVGEVVGDAVRDDVDGSRRWITLASTKDGTYSTIAVLVSEEAVEQIDTYGRYGTTGSTVQVRGVYNLACQEHHGASGIHANMLTVMASGQIHPDSFTAADFIPGLITVALGLVLLGVYHGYRGRMR